MQSQTMLTLTGSNSPHCLNSQYPKRHQDAPCPSVPYWATHCAPKTSDTISSTIVRVKGGFIVPTIALVVISITHTHIHARSPLCILSYSHSLSLCHEGERVRGCFFLSSFLFLFFNYAKPLDGRTFGSNRKIPGGFPFPLLAVQCSTGREN